MTFSVLSPSFFQNHYEVCRCTPSYVCDVGSSECVDGSYAFPAIIALCS